MANTEKSLWRSVRKEQFESGVIKDGKPADGVLYPDFYARELPNNGGLRQPDVELYKDEHGVEWVKPGGGTSLFDVAKVFKGKSWLSFEIPEGTLVPDSLIVRCTGYNARFKADHYQIECNEKPMRIDTFKGALDNLARNAIAKTVELA